MIILGQSYQILVYEDFFPYFKNTLVTEESTQETLNAEITIGKTKPSLVTVQPDNGPCMGYLIPYNKLPQTLNA